MKFFFLKKNNSQIVSNEIYKASYHTALQIERKTINYTYYYLKLTAKSNQPNNSQTIFVIEKEISLSLTENINIMSNIRNKDWIFIYKN